MLLSGAEAERAGRLRFEDDRVRWTHARSALRSVLARYAGDTPESLCFVYGAQGKPALSPPRDIEFNLSHAGDWALIAVAKFVPVGVDIERIRENVDIAALLRRLGESNLPQAVPDLYKAWTRREARSKAVGGAIFDPPDADARVLDLDAPEGYAAAVALLGYEPRVTRRTES